VPQTNSDATLTVGSGTSTLTDEIYGTITLGTPNQGHHATLALVAASHYVQGDTIGDIKGQDDDAAITIATDNVLTFFQILVHGNMQIKGGGSFTNDATVQADGNGTLAVKIDGLLHDIADTGSPNRWKATQPASGNSRLLFTGNFYNNFHLVPLSGDFVISHANAEIQVDELPNWTTFSTAGRLNMSAGTFETLDNMTFHGVLNMTGGQIIVGAGKTFTHD
jgi:hypothetical protein